MEGIYPLKHERLNQLLQSGINVAPFICFAPGKLDEITLRNFFEKYGKISCRHFYADESKKFACPVLYEQTDWWKIIEFVREHNKTYYTLCNEAIALQDSTYAGNIIFHIGDRSYTVEYFEGYGTPRDIEKKNQNQIRIFQKVFGEPAPNDAPQALKELVARLGSFKKLTEIRPLVMEFSLYPYPIGINKVNYVCWEWRRGWLHYPLERISILEARVKELEDELAKVKQEQEINDYPKDEDWCGRLS